ncbi:MAG: cob(I)yrinic acid a,c-diamide adenosyltransferase, partial [Candidatus Omnitrophica bacterium]|nr:cob(I)yrinic acid a,c-diamide adenosyltransferase [Candidatus Omnitrophota bacterium]
MKKLKKGLIHIYTGEGKGKTTAAMGLAFRAMGCGMRVCFLQFFKDKLFPCGEAAAAKRLGKAFKFKRFDVPHPMFCKTGRNALKGRLEKALSEASRIIRSGKFDLVVLDEIIIGVSQGFLTEGEMIKLIKSKP